MATLREWLDKENFDWDSGRILYQETKGNNFPGWDSVIAAQFINFEDSILSEDFHDGFGGPNCPCIIAEDKNALYFPSQYDGATSLEKVFKNIELYLDIENETPYPGGG
jgi:hypothetical protein